MLKSKYMRPYCANSRTFLHEIWPSLAQNDETWFQCHVIPVQLPIYTENFTSKAITLSSNLANRPKTTPSRWVTPSEGDLITKTLLPISFVIVAEDDVLNITPSTQVVLYATFATLSLRGWQCCYYIGLLASTLAIGIHTCWHSGWYLDRSYNFLIISFKCASQEQLGPKSCLHSKCGALVGATSKPPPLTNFTQVWFLSASLYFSKRGAYWDRLCSDVVGWLVGWLVGCHARALWPNGAS